MKKTRLVALAAALAAWAGCAAPAPVARLPALVAKHEWRQADGKLNVAATLANAGGAPARVRVVCQFAAMGGAPAGASLAQTIVLGPGETGTVHFAAADAAALSDTISVRADR